MSPIPSSLSARKIAVSDISNVCAIVFGFAAMCWNVGLIVSGRVAFSATPLPAIAPLFGLPVITRHPLLSHGFFGSIENALNSWFNCDHTLRP